MVEFPIVNALVAVIIRTFPLLPLELTHRMLSVIFSLGSIACLFFLIKPISGVRVALASAAALAFLPFSIFYSRTILPEPALVFFMLLSLWSFQTWLLTKKWRWLSLSLIAVMVALLLKPFVVFFAPVFGALTLAHRRRDFLKLLPILGIFAALSVLPLWWWRTWIEQYPAGIPDNAWLFNGDGIRFRPAWLWWLGYERSIKLILGFAGVFIVGLSWMKSTTKELWVYGAWLAGALAYVTVIATGNVRHDYYQVLLIPLFAILFGRGAVMLHSTLSKKVLPATASAITLCLCVLAITISWWQVKDYYSIHHWNYITAGAAVQRLTDEDALVIAHANGDTMLLYQTHRRGWPIGFNIDEKIALGATHYLSTSYDDEARELERQYFTVEKTPDYLLLDLRRAHLELPL